MPPESSPDFLAVEGLLLSLVESFEQYKKHGVSYICSINNISNGIIILNLDQ